MSLESTTLLAIADEARALLDRLERLKPFVLQVPMRLAAGPSLDAQVAIETALHRGRRALKRRIHGYLHWLSSPEGRASSPAAAQTRYVSLRLRFNIVLTQLDIFNEALTQRSEADNGVWLSGLDEVARDGLRLPGLFEPPPVLCYLARGPGGAIRRARTPLPGGVDNPVALIRLPRERMIGSGIASSLVHEVGHQGAALLDLVMSLRAALRAQLRQAGAATEHEAWSSWSKWISEIIADFWAVARVGVTSTTGLMAVVSLPRAFVFRDGGDDPHPPPWLRVKLSCAIGAALYPHPQWRQLAARWDELYPLSFLEPARRLKLAQLEASIPELVRLLVSHRSPKLQSRTLAQALADPDRSPERLLALWHAWRRRPQLMRDARPTLVFAVVGQARSARLLDPRHESELLAEYLTDQAMRSTLDRAAICARPQPLAAHIPSRSDRLLQAVR